MTGLGVLGGLATGAVLMYLFDPEGGQRRRALACDQLVRAAHKTGDAVDVTSRDVTNRARGVVAELRGRLRSGKVTDAVLGDRVRARIGGVLGHAGAIDVAVAEGRVTLHGPVLAAEVDRLLRKIRTVRGVKAVDNQLTVHAEPGDVPALQGRPRPPPAGEVFELGRRNWSPTVRLVTGGGGGALAATGLRRFDPLGGVLAAIGLTLLYRAATNRPLRAVLGEGAAWARRAEES